jgi:hypothetical protein
MGRQDSAILLEQGSRGGERQGAPRHRSRVAAAWMQLEEEEDPPGGPTWSRAGPTWKKYQRRVGGCCKDDVTPLVLL